MTVPLTDAGGCLVVARAQSPVISGREIDELVRLAELMVTLVRVVLPHCATPPSRLTSRLLAVSLQG